MGSSSAMCAFAAGFAELVVFRAAGGLGSTFFTVSSDLLLISVSHRSTLGRVSSTRAVAPLLVLASRVP